MKIRSVFLWIALLSCGLLAATAASAATGNLLANGGFELSGRLQPRRLAGELKAGITFENDDPVLPLQWMWRGNETDLRLVKEAHGGQQALRIASTKGSITLWPSMIEVVPGASYTVSVWSRGTGKGRLVVHGNAYEGKKELALADLALTDTWTETSATVKIPGNIRTISIDLVAWAPFDILLDDVACTVELDQPFNADDVLTQKPQRDAHTLLLVDFDGQGEFQPESGAALTDEGGGRFGKGLRLERDLVSSAVLPLSLEQMPPQGTLEFWFSPDDDPEHIYWYAALIAGNVDVLKLQADTTGTLRACWRIRNEVYAPQNCTGCNRRTSRDWFRPGQWHHVAIEWDEEAVRLYVDGALASISTDNPLPFFLTPSALKLGSLHSVYAWSGVIDEIRLSDIRRYGPIVPKGAVWMPLVAEAPETEAAPATPPPVAPDFAAGRTNLLGTIPPTPKGAFAFEAAEMRPLIEGSSHFAFVTNRPLPGMVLAQVGNQRMEIHEPDNDGAYWRVGDIPPGNYVIGIWYESGTPGAEANQHFCGALTVYLNGRIVQLDTLSDPVQAAPGLYYAEVQAKEAETIRPGDEIAVLPAFGTRRHIVRLTLYPTEPVRGRNWTQENFGANWFVRPTALSLNVRAAFLPAPGKRVWEVRFHQEQGATLPDDLKKTADGTKALAECRINNPLPVPLTVEFQAEVKAYFREIVGGDRAQLTLPPHGCIVREIPFTIIPDSRRYSIEATVRAIKPPPLGWPVADMVSFFPGVRQSIPWPDPFSGREERSLHLYGALPGERMQFALNGEWQTALTTSLNPPVPPPAEGLEWKPRQVPFPRYSCQVDHIEPRPHGMYLRRTFVVPPDAEPKTWRLLITSVAIEGSVYVNGTRVGGVRGGNTPITCDVTAALRPGTNEILVVQRDLLAIMNPQYVNPAAPVASQSYLDAPGLGSGMSMGDVWLESSPLVAASDLWIGPSVRQGRIQARTRLTSHSDAPVRARVTARVLDAGEPLLEIGTQEITLEPGASLPLEFSKAWKNPELWGPAHPKLYTLAIETTDAASGRRLDLLRERFGFRESWVQGDRIMFNGFPVRMKGSTVHGGGGVLNADDVQWSRGTDCPDFMDEFGYPVSLNLAAIHNSSSRHNVERDEFWAAATSNVLAGAARLAHHPCIIAWDLSNEWLEFLDYGGGDPLAGARRFKALSDALMKFDPTRWHFLNGDEDAHGLLDTFATHYMLESTHPHPIRGFEFRGHSSYFPDGAFFRPLDRLFEPGESIMINVHRRVSWVYGSKPLMNTENLWKTGAYMPPGPSKFAGEDDVLSPAIDSGRGPIAWMWKQNLDGHRDLGVTAICNYTAVFGVAWRGQMRQCFIMPEHTHHAFGGRRLTRAYSLHNDFFVPARFLFQWQLIDPAGRVVRKGQDARRMATGDLQRGTFALTLPAVREPTTFTLKLDLFSDGRFVYGEERDLDIYPDAPIAAGKLARAVQLFDPQGQTARALSGAGVVFQPLENLDLTASNAWKTLLVIGEGAATGANADEFARLQSFVEAGGRMLVLAQTNLLAGLPVRTLLEPREWSSMPFVRTPQHPALKGISTWDLHFWSPDHVSARGAYSKPDGGPAVTLVDSGTDTGLEWAQMMECYRGRGSYLLCQFPVAGNYDADPKARVLLANLLRYAGSETAWRAPSRALEVVAGTDAATVARLRDAGIRCTFVQSGTPLGKGAVRMVDAASLPVPLELPAGTREALTGGATLIVHGARPEHAEALSALAGRPVQITVQPLGMWEGRMYRNGFTWLTPGLSHIDLYWKNYDGWEGAGAQAEEPKHKIEDPIWWSASADGAVEHIYPGGLLEIPVGQGRLILDQVRWETTNDKLLRLATRVLSSIMLGLDVGVEPYVAPRPLPRGIAWKTIDLSPFANRGFRDEVGGDGEGGWSDQGPKADLKDFPTGDTRFGGVPFKVGKEPHSCIVLRSKSRPFPEKMPEEAIIPLGFPVEGLVFLHGLTYSSLGTVGRYQIQYADGTEAEILLEGNENIRDWVSAPAPFPRERGTQSRVAWTGTTELFPVSVVYQMQWVNPRPETPVKSVRFTNPAGKACPILIGLTAAVMPTEGAEADTTAARAQELLAQGLAAFQAGKDAEARNLLQQAVQADPTLEAAHQALGDLADRQKDEDLALAIYRAWAETGPRTPRPWNRIGQILERRKDYKGALEAYRASLKIEWNQPPIIRATSRLQEQVGR